jgi:hypothetical protein
VPQFHFSLLGADQQFALGEGVELADIKAARTQARLAILKVFRERADAHDWSDWLLSIRDRDGVELDHVPINGTLEEFGKGSRGTGEPPPVLKVPSGRS